MFFERLSQRCKQQNTTVYSAVSAVGGNTGSIDGWKKKGSIARPELLSKLADFLYTSVDYLLERTDNPTPISNSMISLDAQEISLVFDLRTAPLVTRETILRMAKAALAPEPKSSLHSTPVPFLAPKDDIIHHEPRERRVRKRVLGRAAAGLPLETVEEFDTYISVPAKYKGDRYFAIQAAGDSMIGLDINNGDYCLFDSQAYRDEGAIMYVQVEGMADGRAGTIKRVYLHPDSDQDGCDAQIELRSANPAYAPMFYPATCVETNGVLALVISPDI